MNMDNVHRGGKRKLASKPFHFLPALLDFNLSKAFSLGNYPFEHEFLTRVSTRIINEVYGLCRVAYDYTSKPPGTIVLE